MTTWDKDAVESPHTQRELGIVTDTSKEAMDGLMLRLLDWDIYDEGEINDAREEAADAITALRAENEALRQQAAAAEAAAYERAASEADKYAYRHGGLISNAIRRHIITPEAASALAAREAAAHRAGKLEGLRAAALIEHDATKYSDDRLGMTFAILALAERVEKGVE